MAHNSKELKVLATPDKGEVSALLIRPSNATHLLVLGHGASTNMRHATLQTIAERLADVGIATFRYNFPYMEHGTGRDSQAVCTATVRSAVSAAQKAARDLPLLAGGHSFGGRMTSTAAYESPLDDIKGLVFFAFPLHMPGKPDTKRAEHLSGVTIPMLFLSGTRDELANLTLLKPVCKKLGKRATLHLLDTADHGFRTLKRSRKNAEDVLRRDGSNRSRVGFPSGVNFTNARHVARGASLANGGPGCHARGRPRQEGNAGVGTSVTRLDDGTMFRSSSFERG